MYCLRTQSVLLFNVSVADGFLNVQIRTDDVELAGDLIQELAEELKVGYFFEFEIRNYQVVYVRH